MVSDVECRFRPNGLVCRRAAMAPKEEWRRLPRLCDLMPGSERAADAETLGEIFAPVDDLRFGRGLLSREREQGCGRTSGTTACNGSQLLGPFLLLHRDVAATLQ